MKDVLLEIEKITGCLATNEDLTETEEQLIFTNLDDSSVCELENLLKLSRFSYFFYDSEQDRVTRFPINNIYNSGPYTLYLNKLKLHSGHSLCVSLKFFKEILNDKDSLVNYVVWGMKLDIPSLSKRFSIFSETYEKNEGLVTAFKSPREIVKCTSAKEVPLDLSFIILSDNPIFDLECSFHKIWIEYVFESYFICLCNEYDSSNKFYKFKGPPKLILKWRQNINNFDVDYLGLLSKCILWVYGNPKNAESKHLFLSGEIPAFDSDEDDVWKFLENYLDDAFEAAKTAYKLSISDLSKDTIKSLTDLRKAIVDETSKIADFTRQIANTIIIALGASVGLVSSKLSQSLSSFVLLLLATIVLFYIGFLIYSAWHQLSIQKGMRLKWRQKLYKFISSKEFEKLVIEPTRKSEVQFRNVSIILVIISLILYVTLVFSIPNKNSLSNDSINNDQANFIESKSIGIKYNADEFYGKNYRNDFGGYNDQSLIGSPIESKFIEIDSDLKEGLENHKNKENLLVNDGKESEALKNISESNLGN